MAKPDSSSVTVIATMVDRCNHEVIDKLEELLGKAKAGEITSIHGIAEKGSNYFVFSTRTVSRQEIAGMLLDVAIGRLTDE